MNALRSLLYLVVGLLLGANVVLAHAATVAVRPPANVGVSASGGYVSNTSSAFSGGAFNSGFTTNVGGKTVTMPASMGMAANAAQFAATAVRGNPTVMIGVAVATWLLPYGIEWVNGQWQANAISSMPGTWYPTVAWVGDPVNCPDMGGCTVEEAAQKQAIRYARNSSAQYQIVNCTAGVNCQVQYKISASWQYAGYVNYQGPTPKRVPATDTHWQAVNTLPDAAANELTAKGVALPLSNPVFNPNSVLEPLTGAYYDPVSGEWKQKSAQVTPAADGKTAEASVVETVVNEDGSPKNDEEGNPETPKTPENHCDQNPNSIGCSEWGEPEDADLGETSKTITITPDTGWGPSTGTCPAPLTHTLSSGRQLSFSYEHVCTAAAMFRPAVIGMAWLSALLLMFGIHRRAST